MNTTTIPTRRTFPLTVRHVVAAVVALLIAGAGATVISLGTGGSSSVSTSRSYALELTRATVEHNYERIGALVYADRTEAERAQLVAAAKTQTQADPNTPPAVLGASYESVASVVDLDQHTELVRVVAPDGHVDTWRWVLAKVAGHWSVVDWDKNP